MQEMDLRWRKVLLSNKPFHCSISGYLASGMVADEGAKLKRWLHGVTSKARQKSKGALHDAKILG
jgi:hypothetical protein